MKKVSVFILLLIFLLGMILPAGILADNNVNVNAGAIISTLPTPAYLDDLKIDGTTVAGFDPYQMSYSIPVSSSASSVQVVPHCSDVSAVINLLDEDLTVIAGTTVVLNTTKPSTKIRVSVAKGGGAETIYYLNFSKPLGADGNRLSGSNRFGTAMEVSNGGWPDGANIIILAAGYNYPDSLVGGPFAFLLNAPILLVNTNEDPDTLGTQTTDEINRLSPDQSASMIILGGESAIDNNVITELIAMGFTEGQISRISGDNRNATAVAIAQYVVGYTNTKTAFMVYSRNYADALAVGPAAARQGWPILYTGKDEIPTDTMSMIETGWFEDIVIVGGESVVSDSVENALITELGEGHVVRIAGENRMGTALAIAEEYFPTTQSILASTGYNFPDALAGCPLAGALGSPILLVRPGQDVPQEVLDYITDSGATDLAVLGGVIVISNEILNELLGAMTS